MKSNMSKIQNLDLGQEDPPPIICGFDVMETTPPEFCTATSHIQKMKQSS